MLATIMVIFLPALYGPLPLEWVSVCFTAMLTATMLWGALAAMMCRRIVAAAENGRFTFMVVAPWLPGEHFTPLTISDEMVFLQRLVAAPGRLLHDSLSAVLALGTLHPLITVSCCREWKPCTHWPRKAVQRQRLQ